MKYIIILAFGLYSCGAQFHLNKASKHQAKAIDKGAVLSVSNDTLYVNDTIVTTQTVKSNDTVYVNSVQTIEKVVYRDSEIRYITRKDKRKEVRQVKTDTKRQFKLDKINGRTERVKIRKSNKGFFDWKIILIIALLILTIYIWKARK